MAIVVGLIGGIGSGKSRVAAAFAGYGARVISGDTLGHEALDQPQIKKKVAERWGSRVLDRQGKIDRPALGTIVFADAAERKELEALVHPYIKGRLAEEIAAARANKDVNLILVDAAVMVEAGWSEHCDRILFLGLLEHLPGKAVAFPGGSLLDIADVKHRLESKGGGSTRERSDATGRKKSPR